MGRINVLGFDVANLIAAGEVVDRPASVVKELCENSIDAGAKNITVEIRHGGTTLIRVSDNGCGIEPDDVPLTVLRHATSKIATAEDLAAIGTLGFRGEALAAIASVCKLRMISRVKENLLGTIMECEGGEIIDITETGASVGTTVVVSELFYNVPARRKFLKKDASEGAAVSAVMEKIAVSSPEVSIKYIQDGVVRFTTTGSGKLIDAIYSVFGKDTAKRMSPVDRTDGNGIRIFGYIGEPDLVRSNKNSENFFINGRFVKSRTAMAAIEQAYSTRIPHSKFPVCILNIQLNPAIVDVNVHPSKLEVKFANERIIFEAVYYAVLNTLESSASRPEMRLGSSDLPFFGGDTPKAPPKRPEPYKKSQTADPRAAFVPVERPREERPDKAQIKISVPTPAPTPSPTPRETAFAPLPGEMPPREAAPKAASPETPPDVTNPEKAQILAPTPVPTPKSAPSQPEGIEKKAQKAEPAAEECPIPDYKILGEAYNCYVIVQLEDRLLMIDKHAAHERILFDELCKNMERGEKTSQILMYPLRIPIREAEALALEEYGEKVRAMGFAYTYERERASLCVTEVPTHLGRDTGADMISELATVLSDATGSVEATGARFFEAKLYQASCKAAIKGGRVYGQDHIKWICDRLLKSPGEDGAVIKTCPHGRPVAFEIKKTSIERQFERLV
ncbi:MAG: DNA mismatch repair endonuclease MutL [Clostridia bacterium]|nr:DNA mismatch repair endonuclease MutL [Clostridia bacterium]